MKKRKNIIISAITCMMSICLMMFGVYAASNPSVSITGQVSYSIHDAKVMVQGKINGTKEYPTDVDYKKPTNINNLTAGDKLTDSQNQFLNFTTGASLNNDTNDDLGIWNFGNLNFYEDQDGIKTIRISLLVTNLSNYPVKATLTYSNSYDNVTIESNKLEAYLAKYDQSKNADADQSLLTNDEFVVELKVTDDSKNASANNFSMNIKIEKYSDPDATLDKLTLTYNGTLYENYGSYGDTVIGATSPQGLQKYYLAEIKQDATGEVVIPAMYNDGEHGDLPVVPGRVNGILLAAAGLTSGKEAAEAIASTAIPNVTKVVVNTGVTETQSLAFATMTALESVQLPSSLIYHQGGTFGYDTTISNISLPYGTNALNTFDFGESGSMGMFTQCQNLETFWMPDTVVSAGSGTFANGDFFGVQTKLKNVRLSQNLQALSADMFGANQSLGFIEIPKSVKTIGGNALCECGSLKIKLNEGLERIESSAFNDTHIDSLVLPSTLNYIGTGAFTLTIMDKLVVRATTPPQVDGELGSTCFSTMVDAKIYVPAASVEAYKTANYWSEFADKIQAMA